MSGCRTVTDVLIHHNRLNRTCLHDSNIHSTTDKLAAAPPRDNPRGTRSNYFDTIGIENMGGEACTSQ
ncbi:hypothetical protein BA059_02735 [Mycolicibacterium sp. (ex Dasyatis americana)]|nr:hypothetical protein BA059_02735 [Mycolicibacterium sp. (ex Dasyatis americana)]